MESHESNKQKNPNELFEFVKGLSHKEQLGLLCLLKILTGKSEEGQKKILEVFQQQKEKELSPGWVSGFFLGMAYKENKAS